jgi:GDP-L-fucose synthase
MKILVTGATGFLGTALCLKLEKEGHELMRLGSQNCNLAEQGALEGFNGLAYDRIYHLAAWTQAGDFCLYHAGEQWVINQQINTNVLAWWQKHQPQAKLVGIGSSCAYDPNLPLTEENYLLGTPIESLFSYAMTKRMLYAGLLSLSKQFGLKYLYLVPNTLYGPGYHTDGRQMHFIYDVIRKIMRGKIYGEEVILWGDGYQRRELVYIDDFIKALLRLSDKCHNDIVNVGSGEEFDIRHFAQLICEKVGYDFNKIQFDASRYVGVKSKCLQINKLRNLIPELTFTPLDAGLEKTIEWFWKEKEKLLTVKK